MLRFAYANKLVQKNPIPCLHTFSNPQISAQSVVTCTCPKQTLRFQMTGELDKSITLHVARGSNSVKVPQYKDSHQN